MFSGRLRYKSGCIYAGMWTCRTYVAIYIAPAEVAGDIYGRRSAAALLAFDHSNIWAARSALASPCPLAYNKKPRGQGEERTWTQAPYVLELWTPSGPDSGSSALRRALSFCDFQPALHPGDERTCPGFLVPTSGRISTVMTISSSVVVIKLSCLHVFLGIYDY
jgi:hypothetical protein